MALVGWPSIPAAVLATGLALTTPAQANLLLNPGFETGSFSNWSASSGTSVVACAGLPVGCAPSGGTYAAAINTTLGNVNANVTQTVILPGPGRYSFGAYLTFVTNNAAGNFDQGQISLTVQIVGGASETVGFDSNALNGQFTIDVGSGFFATPWMLLSDTLLYSGVGPASAIISINVQNFSSAITGIGANNAFVEGLPEPATLFLVGSGLIGLAMRSRRRRA